MKLTLIHREYRAHISRS